MDTTTTNAERLRIIMAENRLTREQIAELTDRSIDTVASWLRTRNTPGHRNMPTHALKLLIRQLEGKK